MDDELEEIAASFFCRSPHGHKIRHHVGSALDIAPTLGCTFDLVFIDGDKREYPDYYRMLMGGGGGKALVHSGSILIADNILWSGKVVEPVAHNDRHTQALLQFNRMVPVSYTHLGADAAVRQPLPNDAGDPAKSRRRYDRQTGKNRGRDPRSEIISVRPGTRTAQGPDPRKKT